MSHQLRSWRAAEQSIRQARKYVKEYFQVFLMELDLYSKSKRDIFQEFLQRFSKLNDEQRKLDGFYNDYHTDCKEIRKHKREKFLANSIFVSKFNDKLTWSDVAEIAAKSISYGLMVETLNGWDVKRSEKETREKVADNSNIEQNLYLQKDVSVEKHKSKTKSASKAKKGIWSKAVVVPSKSDLSKRKIRKLTYCEIALIYIYNNEEILGIEHASQIAKDYFQKISETTGKQIYDKYCKHRRSNDRLSKEGKRSIGNMIARISNILPYISNKKKREMAERERNELEGKYQKI